MNNTSLTVKSSKGFSLVEAMVAMVVLSIGMLGIAGLYVESLRSGRTALLRTQAVVLAADMADRIRANNTARIAYASTYATAPATAVTACQPGGATCNTDQMAANDLYWWSRALNAALPGIDYSITVDDPNPLLPAIYVITVTWQEAGEGTPSYALELRT